MNYLFRGGSDVVVDKPYFYQQNHLFPYVKLITLQAAEIDCGSDVSNWISKNKKATEEAASSGDPA
jgi:hypothetical protein